MKRQPSVFKRTHPTTHALFGRERADLSEDSCRNIKLTTSIIVYRGNNNDSDSLVTKMLVYWSDHFAAAFADVL